MPGGRPKFTATKEQRDMVFVLAGAGIDQERISQALGITAKTLRKAFPSELATGQSKITAQAVGTLVKAMSSGGRGAVAAACFWLKTRERWTETTAHQFVDTEGKDRDIRVEVVYVDAKNTA